MRYIQIQKKFESYQATIEFMINTWLINIFMTGESVLLLPSATS